MVNLIDFVCKICLIKKLKKESNKYNGLCIECYNNTCINEDDKINYKPKELSIKRFLNENIKDHTFKNDKIIKFGNLIFRPDFYLEIDNKLIIIEIDEKQHKNYLNDTNRYNSIKKMCEEYNKNLTFIRFNPDSYKNGNQRIKSCWKKENDKIILKNKNDWLNRLNNLLEIVCNNINENIDQSILIYLYFDK
jgi:predicted nuclease of restriction endonuclease-like RecB superfamily